MHGDLRMQGMGQQPALGIVQSQAGFIAGGFDAENNHGGMKRGVASFLQSGIVKESAYRLNRP
jgi:hypothetical protein